MVLALVTIAAVLAGLRVAVRLVATAGGAPLGAAPPAPAPARSLDVIVPVLDEELRLGPALAAVSACDASVGAILVVDGGSRDGTRALVLRAAATDARIRLIEAGPPPPGWNGKAWNLATGLRHGDAPYVATVDADARVEPGLFAAALARLDDARLVALSVATRQELADLGAGLLHPALLTTLVYTAGIPNTATSDPLAVQANGQVFLARRDALVEGDAFAVARASRCEDVTVARVLAARGGRVGFYEGDAVVRMHESWRDCARNWPRSLTLRDQFVSATHFWLRWTMLLLAQGLPLPLLILAPAGALRAAALGLVFLRLGVLAGTRRAYVRAPWTYWLSPLADLPALALLAASALRRRHIWRGRTLVEESS
ncbi:MAG: glycosyltransferase family 2 protein [Vulcanimicrobiaceae bacterium]|jgi:dolichol-phosphate mannosyltransferase